jgi:hypothetical protein
MDRRYASRSGECEKNEERAWLYSGAVESLLALVLGLL